MAAASTVLERSVTAIFISVGAWAVWAAWAEAPPPSPAGGGFGSARSEAARANAKLERIQKQANAYQARLYLDEARKCRQTDPNRALELYNQACALDPTNPVAIDGRTEMLRALGIDVGTGPPLPHQVVTPFPYIQFEFDTAIADADSALRTGNLAAAEEGFERARDAAAADPGIFSPREIANQNRRLANLRSQIDAARDAAEARRRGGPATLP